jgi:membrane-associated phospholipid phosphatase
MNIRRFVSHWSPVDVVSIAFLLFLVALNLIFFSRVEAWSLLVGINLAVIAGILLLAHAADTHRTKLLVGLHRWYCYPFVIFVFKELYLMVRPIHPIDYDALLIRIDHAMFGVNPTQWLGQFAHPVLTEVLQVAYFSYYLLFIILGVEIYRRYAIEEFDKAAFLIVYGFYLSYLGYFLLPGIGPRFTLHDFALMDTELPGLFFTQYLRDFINAAESIPRNHPNPADVVQRDVFPSGHTQMTLIITFLAFRYKVKARWLLTSLAVLLVIGTVYLRYHYVIDLIAGAAFTWLTFWSGDRIEAWWSTKMRAGAGPLETHPNSP